MRGTKSRLLAGRVVRVRLNPQDCMGTADVIERLGLSSERFSFDTAVRIAFSSLLESARVHGAIPRRDGFEYNSMMQRFQERISGDRAAKLDVTSLINNAGSEHQVRPLVTDPATRLRFLRYEELKFKQEFDKLNWTDELQQEFMPLVDEFYH